MSLHFDPEVSPARAVPAAWRERGRRAYHAGLCAEEAVERDYMARGAVVLRRRWRGKAGEVDLILDADGVTVFCEVKCARDEGEAWTRLRPAQAHRIRRAAAEFSAHLPDGLLSEMRFDLAWADDTGQVGVSEGAFSHF